MGDSERSTLVYLSEEMAQNNTMMLYTIVWSWIMCDQEDGYTHTKATPSGSLVSDQGFPQDSMWAGGFCHCAIMHIGNSTQ